MREDQIKTVLRSEPFQPFELQTAGGQRFTVRHPEMLALSPGGRTLIVWDEPDGAIVIDLLLVETLRPLKGSPAGGGKNGAAHG